MTTVHRVESIDAEAVNSAYLPRAAAPVRTWPLALLIAGYPLIWLAGFAFMAAPMLAVPMAWELYRRRRLRVPAGFGFWLLLLVVLALSVTMLAEHAPGTLPKEAGAGRYLAFSMRWADYASAAIVMLYIGNLTEKELPTAKVLRWLSVFFTVTVAGGFAGLLLPPTKLVTPAYYILPGFVKSNDFVKHLVTVNFAQYQSILGENTAPRPAAPFLYTNTWGYMLSMLLPWFVIGAVLAARTPWRRIAAVAVLAAASVPIVYSLNRGLWLALLVLTGYVLVRLILRGTIVPAAVMLAVASVAGVVLVTSPLAGVLLDRLDNPHSNQGRESTGMLAFQVAQSSPFVGYGGQLTAIGSERSIAIGPTPSCRQCGGRDVGKDGQLWQLLVTVGFVGTACYLAFFLRVWWRYRRDPSPVGIAGAATTLLMLFYLPLYTSVGMPLVVAMVGIGLWWRNATETGVAK